LLIVTYETRSKGIDWQRESSIFSPYNCGKAMEDRSHTLIISEPATDLADCTQEAFKKRLREERTLSLWSQDAEGVKFNIRSKSIQHVTIRRAPHAEEHIDETLIEGVYCIDRVGSKKGYLITGCNTILGHLKEISEDNSRLKFEVTFRKPTGREVAEWLEGNFDPQRKALGAILGEMCAVTEEAKAEISELLKTTENNLSELRTLNRNMIREGRKAEQQRIEGFKAKKVGVVIAVSGFALGSLLDLGLLEDHKIIELTNNQIIGGLSLRLSSLRFLDYP
jgi:hypothetical protein